jgi:hypothetical protein
MSEHSANSKKYLVNFDLFKGLVHVCNSLLLRLAAVDMNNDGESKWLNSIMVDLDNQPLETDAKEMILDMVSAVETSLRSIAQKERGGE